MSAKNKNKNKNKKKGYKTLSGRSAKLTKDVMEVSKYFPVSYFGDDTNDNFNLYWKKREEHFKNRYLVDDYEEFDFMMAVIPPIEKIVDVSKINKNYFDTAQYCTRFMDDLNEVVGNMKRFWGYRRHDYASMLYHIGLLKRMRDYCEKMILESKIDMK